jgi:hypothetical protein
MNQKDKINLDVPYSSLPSLDEQVADSVEEVAENHLTYSRFKNVHSRATEAEREAANARREADEWRQRYESYTPPQQQTSKSDVPQYWVKLYGDSPESLEGWNIQSQANEELKAEAKREALESFRNERYEEAERIDYNMDTIDENLDRLSAYVGRDLTDREQSTILDIVDEYTPQDAHGNYLGAVLPFEKAWEIYELKNTASKAPARQARDSVASLSSQNTQGETDITDKDKNWNPLDWGAYKRRI